MGRAVWSGLLDLIDANPLSRLPRSEYRNLEGVRKAVEKYVDDTWGLDEQPKATHDKQINNSLPRVAMIGPKVMNKSYTEKLKEENELKERKRQRLERIRKGYLEEMKERREKPLNIHKEEHHSLFRESIFSQDNNLTTIASKFLMII